MFYWIKYVCCLPTFMVPVMSGQEQYKQIVKYFVARELIINTWDKKEMDRRATYTETCCICTDCDKE